jgi:hypothetical protein
MDFCRYRSPGDASAPRLFFAWMAVTGLALRLEPTSEAVIGPERPGNDHVDS